MTYPEEMQAVGASALGREQDQRAEDMALLREILSTSVNYSAQLAARVNEVADDLFGVCPSSVDGCANGILQEHPPIIQLANELRANLQAIEHGLNRL